MCGRDHAAAIVNRYFDRTLAALKRRVLTIGVRWEELRVPTIYPQLHDIPMDFIVTEAGVYRAGGDRLAALDASESAIESKSVLESRGLPRQRQLSPAALPRAQHKRAGNSTSPGHAHEAAKAESRRQCRLLRPRTRANCTT